MIFNFDEDKQKKTDSAFTTYPELVSQDKSQTEKMAKEIKTLKTLKPWLEQRYDSHNSMAELEELMNLYQIHTHSMPRCEMITIGGLLDDLGPKSISSGRSSQT